MRHEVGVDNAPATVGSGWHVLAEGPPATLIDGTVPADRFSAGSGKWQGSSFFNLPFHSSLFSSPLAVVLALDLACFDNSVSTLTTTVKECPDSASTAW